MSLKSCSVLLSGLLLWNLAALPARAESYQWPSQIPSPLKAPTDQSMGRLVKGAALQGGLLDLRFGQASVDVQGVGHILDWNNLSKFTLDGRACDAKALEKAVKDGKGLSVAVRYNPESGLIGWMDAVSGRPQASVVTRLSSTGILKPGDTLHVAVPASEAKRLKLQQAYLSVPGVCRQLRMKPHNGGFETEIPVLAGVQWRSLPLFIQSAAGKTFRGSTISISGRAPIITRFGPHKAEAGSIPCWVDYDGPAYLLEPGKTVDRVSPQAQISHLIHRPGRVHFWLSSDKPGLYTIEVKTTDKVGRQSTASWSLTIDEMPPTER